MKYQYLLIFITASLINNNVYSQEYYNYKVVSNHQYTASKSNIPFATTQKKILRDGKKWVFIIQSKTTGIFKLKKDIRSEISEYIIKDNVIPLNYYYNRDQKKQIENITTHFLGSEKEKYITKKNINGNLEIIKHNHIDMIHDRLSVQIDFRNKLKKGIYDQEYKVLDKGRMRNYIFKYIGKEKMNTIFGEIEAIKIHRSIENNKRNTYTWYAINHDFIPIRIEQYRNKSHKFTIELEKVLK